MSDTKALWAALLACGVVSLIGATLSGRPHYFALPVAACIGPVLLARRPRDRRVATVLAIAVVLFFSALAAASIGVFYLPSILLLGLALFRRGPAKTQ